MVVDTWLFINSLKVYNWKMERIKKWVWKYWTWTFIITINIICILFLYVLYQTYQVVVIFSAVCGFIILRTVTHLGSLLNIKREMK